LGVSGSWPLCRAGRHITTAIKQEGPPPRRRGFNFKTASPPPLAQKTRVGRWTGGIGVVAPPAVIPVVIPPVAAVPAAAVVPAPAVVPTVFLPVLLSVPLPVPLNRA